MKKRIISLILLNLFCVTSVFSQESSSWEVLSPPTLEVIETSNSWNQTPQESPSSEVINGTESSWTSTEPTSVETTTETTTNSWTTNSWTTISSPPSIISPDRSSEEVLNDLQRSKTKVTQLLDTNSELNTQISTLEKNITVKEVEINSLKNINQKLESEIDTLYWRISQWDSQKEKLLAQIKWLESTINENLVNIAKLESDKLNNTLLLEELAKTKLQLETKKNQEINKKLFYVILLLWIIIWALVITRYLLSKHREEVSHDFTRKGAKLNLLSSFLIITLVFSVCASIFYLKPELAIWLLFVWSAIIVILKDIIVSFLMSIYAVISFRIGDMIYIIDWTNRRGWRIIEFNAIHLILREYDYDLNLPTWVNTRIPYKELLEKNTIRSQFKEKEELFEWKITFKLANLTQTELSEISKILLQNIDTHTLEELGNNTEYKDKKYMKKYYQKEAEMFVQYNFLETEKKIKKIQNELSVYFLKSKDWDSKTSQSQTVSDIKDWT